MLCLLLQVIDSYIMCRQSKIRLESCMTEDASDSVNLEAPSHNVVSISNCEKESIESKCVLIMKASESMKINIKVCCLHAST